MRNFAMESDETQTTDSDYPQDWDSSEPTLGEYQAAQDQAERDVEIHLAATMVPNSLDEGIAQIILKNDDQWLHLVLTHKTAVLGRRALAAYSTDLPEDFKYFAGAALELAVKARLAGESPIFLAPDVSDWFKHAESLRSKNPAVAASAKSIGGAAALDRLSTLDPTITKDTRKSVESAFKLRNEAVHLYSPRLSVLDFRKNAAAFVLAIEEIVKPQDHSSFWGNELGVVDSLRADRATHNELDLQRLKRNCEERLAAYSQSALRSLEGAAAALASQLLLSPEQYRSTVPCPVCANPAWVEGPVHDVGGYLVKRDEDGEPIGTWEPDFHMWVMDFKCEVCGLELDGDLLDLSGVELSLPRPELGRGAAFVHENRDSLTESENS
jgi:hypothetical protein